MMRKNKVDWTDIVADALREAEEPLPSGGWQRLEREMDVPRSLSAQTPKRKWIGYAAAAASILVCVTIGVQVLRINHNVMNKGVVPVSGTAVGGFSGGTGTQGVPVSSSHAGTSLPATASEGAEAHPAFSEGGTPRAAETARPQADRRSMERAGLSGLKTAGGSLAEVAEPTPPAADASRSGNAGLSACALPSGLRTVQKPETSSSAFIGNRSADKDSAPDVARPYRTADYDGLFADAAPAVRKHGGSAGIFASGAIAGSGSQIIGGPFYSAVLVEKNEVVDLRDAYGSYYFKHKQPLSFGLTFRKEFKYGLSLETGLNYTLLRSEVAVTGKVKEVSQQLHFIGIPLRANWQFLRAGCFSMYIGAGGMAEKCVSARFGDEKATERQVQWSLSGILGAQCMLGRTVGIYFEPSVTHYLTHTSLRTAYTDSPAAVDLRFGLRFTY